MVCSICGSTFSAAGGSVCTDCGLTICPACRHRSGGLCPHCCGQLEHVH